MMVLKHHYHEDLVELVKYVITLLNFPRLHTIFKLRNQIKLAEFGFDLTSLTQKTVEKLSIEIFCRNLYFNTDSRINQYDALQYSINQIKKWSKNNQYQLCTEALKQLNFCSDKIDKFYFKAKQMSIQQGIRKHSQQEKDLVTKATRNLAEKKECFGKVDQESLT